MQRSTTVGSIYGYLVCLLAILLFIHSGPRFVSGLFNVASPILSYHHRGVSTEVRDPRIWVARGSTPTEGSSTSGANGDASNLSAAARGRMVVRVRFQAARALVINLILITTAVLLFGWHWQWLQARETPSSPTCGLTVKGVRVPSVTFARVIAASSDLQIVLYHPRSRSVPTIAVAPERPPTLPASRHSRPSAARAKYAGLVGQRHCSAQRLEVEQPALEDQSRRSEPDNDSPRPVHSKNWSISQRQLQRGHRIALA